MRSIGRALAVLLLALVAAAPALADDASIWSVYSGRDAAFVEAGFASLRACHAVERTHWQAFGPLIAAERHRGRVIHAWALAVRAETASSPVGADGRSLALKG